jgi:hypothetical protein
VRRVKGVALFIMVRDIRLLTRISLHSSKMIIASFDISTCLEKNTQKTK